MPWGHVARHVPPASKIGINVDFRIARGLSINAEGNISWVNDQIYLSAEGATAAEALPNLQQRSQDFNYSLQLGFSFHSSAQSKTTSSTTGSAGGGGFRSPAVYP